MTLVVKPHPRWQAPVQDIPSVVQGRLPEAQQTEQRTVVGAVGPGLC